MAINKQCKMRPRVYVLFIFLACLIFLATRLVAFIQLFFEHSGIAITQAEIKAAHEAITPDTRPQQIPKIIHQVYHNWNDPTNDTLPPDWDEVRHTCISYNPDWQYKLWTARTSRQFIEEFYPWFLKTYDSYPYPIQRVDTVRYFILRHLGGIYIDLDNGCLQNLDAFLYYPTWTTDGARGALSNNILASRPNHPFWTLMTESLPRYNWNYIFPYVTISFASGQWYHTAIWEQYHASLPRLADVEAAQENRLYRIMMDGRPGAEPWIYFTQGRGTTWVNWDNAFWLWIGEHLILLGLVIAFLIGLGLWILIRCMRASERPRKKGYAPLNRRGTNDLELQRSVRGYQ